MFCKEIKKPSILLGKEKVSSSNLDIGSQETPIVTHIFSISNVILV